MLPTSPPPGWYPDPAAPDWGERWWDGQEWSAAVRPSTLPPGWTPTATEDQRRPPQGRTDPYWSSVAPRRRRWGSGPVRRPYAAAEVPTASGPGVWTPGP
ncbi:MAG: DUF2510 domain-containing protein, partial [Acidimicrobiales bacterium]